MAQAQIIASPRWGDDHRARTSTDALQALAIITGIRYRRTLLICSARMRPLIGPSATARSEPGNARAIRPDRARSDHGDNKHSSDERRPRESPLSLFVQLLSNHKSYSLFVRIEDSLTNQVCIRPISLRLSPRTQKAYASRDPQHIESPSTFGCAFRN